MGISGVGAQAALALLQQSRVTPSGQPAPPAPPTKPPGSDELALVRVQVAMAQFVGSKGQSVDLLA